VSDWLEELKRRRVVRAVLTFAAVAFVALQVADLTFESLGLPEWAYRFVVVLSAVGLPVTAVAAWFFDLKSGRLERDLVDVGDEGADAPSVARTSPLAAFGVVAATLVVSGVVTLALQGPGSAPSTGPVDADLIAVAPFRVAASDASLTYLREGAVDLLAAKLRDSPRVVDPRTLFTAWRDRAGTVEADLPQEEVVAWAASVGAGRVLLGSVVGSPEQLTLNASLLEVPGGAVVAETTLEAPGDSLASLIDGLAGRLVGVQAGAPVSLVTSRSMVAVRHYLDGQAAYRTGDFEAAAEAYGRAVQEDSTFAAAALGSITTNAMRVSGADTEKDRRLAWENRDRLSEDDRLVLRGVLGRDYPDRTPILEQIEFLQGLAERIPDRVEVWHELGEELFHDGNQTSVSDELLQAADAFGRAVELDPGFFNGRLHLAWTYRVLADPRWREATPVDPAADPVEAAGNFGVAVLPTEAQFETIRSLSPEALQEVESTRILAIISEVNVELLPVDRAGELVPVTEDALMELSRRSLNPGFQDVTDSFRYSFLMNLKRWEEARAFSESLSGPPGSEAWLDHQVHMLEAPLLWGAPGGPQTTAAAEQVSRWWAADGADRVRESEDAVRAACALGLHRVAQGEDDRARRIADVLQPEAPLDQVQGDLLLSARRSCSLLLRAVLEDAGPAPQAGAGVQGTIGGPALTTLRNWLDLGPAGARMRLVANLVLARMLNDRSAWNAGLAHARRGSRSGLLLVHEYRRPLTEEMLRAVSGRGEDLGARTLRRRLAGWSWPVESR